jgi:hypothetical protein
VHTSRIVNDTLQQGNGAENRIKGVSVVKVPVELQETIMDAVLHIVVILVVIRGRSNTPWLKRVKHGARGVLDPQILEGLSRRGPWGARI